MNAAAFRRGEAITRLENYAPVIVEHLALVTWYPNHSPAKHWQSELDAFTKALTRYNTGKGNKHNFTAEIIVETLMDVLSTNEERDYVLIGVESHGVVIPDQPDWDGLDKKLREFALNVVK
ncbi:MAG TPA: hypothetical protein VEL47_07810 [Myxococcota bacterium]|nr:hypothetical protein [Myxococcota bacterium]